MLIATTDYITHAQIQKIDTEHARFGFVLVFANDRWTSTRELDKIAQLLFPTTGGSTDGQQANTQEAPHTDVAGEDA